MRYVEIIICVLLSVYSIRRLIWFNKATCIPATCLERYKGRIMCTRVFIVLGGLFAVLSALDLVWRMPLPDFIIAWLTNCPAKMVEVGYMSALAGLFSFGVAAFISNCIRKRISLEKAKRVEDYYVETQGFSSIREIGRK